MKKNINKSMNSFFISVLAMSIFNEHHLLNFFIFQLFISQENCVIAAYLDFIKLQ